MLRFLLTLILVLPVAPSSAQEETGTTGSPPVGEQTEAAGAGETTAAAGESDEQAEAASGDAETPAADGEDGEDGDGEIDDSDLDEQVYREDEDDFTPSEEIPVDHAVPFPTDI